MKKFVLLAMGLLFLPLLVSAYQVNIEAPEKLTVGKPLIVTGTTTFGIGTPIDVVLYYQLTTNTEIKRKIVYVQPDKTFKAVFDTSGLKTGTYKVEVPASGLGDSTTMRVIYLEDRADDIHIASSTTQPFTGNMYVAGTIKGGQNSGIQIEVFDPDTRPIFGPQYVNTNYQGDFSVDVPVSGPGEYEISFTDSRGYIGTKTITIAGTTSLSATPVSVVTTAAEVRSAHSRSSQDSPAYFIVKPGSGPVSIYTSATADWVLEYTDAKGAIRVINNNKGEIAERVTFTGNGKTVYVKVYPAAVTQSTEAFLYGENANSVTVSQTPPAVFAAQATEAPAETPQSPLFPALCLAALGITPLLLRSRR